MDHETAARAAAALADARRTGQLIEALPDPLRPGAIADSYAIQDAYIPLILELSGGSRVGYKAGATGDAPQKMLALDGPFHGVLLSAFVVDSGSHIAAKDCNARVLEVEFAFRMAEDLPASAAPYDPDAVRAAVGSLITAIEVVDFRYSSGFAAGGLQVVADNGAAGYWVMGREIADFADIDLDDFAVSLVVNGEKVADGNSANVLDNPINSLTWLANNLALSGGGLKAGDIVTAGSCTAPRPAALGDHVVADFGALGQVELTFDA